MELIVNDKSCVAKPGQTLGQVAWRNMTHVGCVCAGRGICQTCYVTVQEGADCLSAFSDVEEAFLSPRQKSDGGRLACKAVIEREGRIRILSRPEEVRRILFADPAGLFAYGATMGQDTAASIVSGVQNLVGRIAKGAVHPLPDRSVE